MHLSITSGYLRNGVVDFVGRDLVQRVTGGSVAQRPATRHGCGSCDILPRFIKPASPKYLETYGSPRTSAELVKHRQVVMQAAKPPPKGPSKACFYSRRDQL
jgi:hypothetical protein